MVINKITMNIKSSLGRVSNNTNPHAQQQAAGDAFAASQNGGAGGEEILDTNIKTPRERDILLGRGRTSWSHTGNQQFRSFVGLYLKQYTEAKSRNEKTKTVELIYDELIAQGGRFLKLDASTETWYQVGKAIAREKIAHALRDAIGLRIKLGPADPSLVAASSASSSRSANKSTSQRATSSSSASRSSGGSGGGLFSRQPPAPRFIQPDESLFVHDNPTPDESISCEKSGSQKSQQYTTSEAAEALIEGPDSNVFRKQKRQNAASASSRSSRKETMTTSNSNSNSSFNDMVDDIFFDYSSHANRDDDSEFGGRSTAVSANRTITSMDDELSTGLSAMSLDNKSTRSGFSLKSGKSGGTFSASGKSKSSAVFELCADFPNNSHGHAPRFHHPIMNAPIIGEGANNNNHLNNQYSDRQQHHYSLDRSTPDSVMASLQKREQEAMLRHYNQHHRGGHSNSNNSNSNHHGDDDSDDDILDSDIFDGMSADDLSAMGSLDEFSIASKSRASAGARKAYVEGEAMSHQEDSSQKSSETEKEWRKTLMALREN